MPKKDETVKVLGDFLATKNTNPNLSNEEISQKFPEVKAFSELKGVDESTVINEMNSYYDKYKEGVKIEKLNSTSDFFFGDMVQAVEPKEELPSLNSQVLGEFVATKNANPDLTPEEIQSKFPEIKALSELSGAPVETIIGKADNYYQEYKSGKKLEELNKTFDFNIPVELKKKEETFQDDSGIPTDSLQPVSQSKLNIPDQQEQSSPLVGSTLESNQYGAENTNIAGSRGDMMNTFKLGLPENQIQSTFSDNPNQIKDFQEGVTDVTSELKTDLDERIEKDERTIRKELSDQFDISPEELDKQIGQRSLLMALEDPDGSQINGSDPKKETKLYLRNKYANQEIASLGKKGKKEFYNRILDETDGDDQKAQEVYSKKMDDIGFSFTSENDLKIKDLKEQIFELESTPERSSKDNLSLKQKQETLQKLIDLGLTGENNMFDPKTGQFISGNTKDKDVIDFNKKVAENVVKYNNTDVGTLRKLRDDLYFQYQNYVNDVMIDQDPNLSAFDKEVLMRKSGLFDANDPFNDKGIELPKEVILDAAIRQYESGFTGYKNLLLGGLGGEGDDSKAFKLVNSGFWSDKYTGKANDILANYIAVNKMLTLNEDPGSVKENEGFTGFVDSAYQGLEEALGGTSRSNPVLADRAINQLEGIGYELTDDQKSKLDKTLGQKVGKAVGSSIPISLEIGFQLLLANKAAGVLKIPELAQALAGGNKVKQFGLTMLYESALQGTAFAASGESFSSGVGEGVGQVLGSAVASRFGVKNELLKFITRATSGAGTETLAEYSGQFFEEMVNNGMDLQKAADETFGKTADEAIEKLAITYFTALTMGMGGASQESNLFIENAQKEIQNSDSDSPIVKAAKEYNVSGEITNEETVELSELEQKIRSGDELTQEEILRSEFLETKKEFVESKTDLESNPEKSKIELSPTIISDTNKDVEYKFKEEGKEGFVSSEEISEKLDDPVFIEKIKSGEIELNVTNPSPDIESKIKESFIENQEVEQLSKELSKESFSEPGIKEVVDVTNAPIEELPTDVIDESIVSPTVDNISQKIFNSENNIGEKQRFTAPEISFYKKNKKEVDLKLSNLKESLAETEIESEIKTEIKPEKIIKEKADKIAKKILEAKISLTDLSSLSSNPVGALIETAWNSSLTAASLSVQVTGTVAQAVSDGVKALKASEWYKSLSEEGKASAEGMISDKLKSAITDAQTSVTSDENITNDEPTPFNESNKRFAERLDKQTDINRETKDRIVEQSRKTVTNQKKLLSNTKKVFDESMKEVSNDYTKVIQLADSPGMSPEYTEMLYAHVMQHLSVLEKSSNPNISKAASNDLVDYGIRTAERLNASGKQIKSIGTIYKNFSMYSLYSSMARIEKFTQKKNDKQSPPGDIKKEASATLKEILSDVDVNLDEYLNDPDIKNRLDKINKKLDRRKRKPSGLSNERKVELAKRKKAIADKFYGRKGKLQSGIPLGDQLVAMLEYAGVLIEEGFYRSQDIVAEIKDALNITVSDSELKSELKKLKEFRDLLNKEKKDGVKKDSTAKTISSYVSDYLKAGLESVNLTMKEAIVSSDKTKKKIKNDLLDSLIQDFDLSKTESEGVVDVIDGIFRKASVKALKTALNSQFSKISIKKQRLMTKADKLSKDVSLGAFDMSMSVVSMTFDKHGMVNTNDPEIINKLRELSDKMRNAPDGMLKDLHRKNLETFIHNQTNGYGFMDWLFTRFYGSILSGPITHAKNLKYNTFAIGMVGPLTQIYTTGANPIRTYKEMFNSFMKVDRKASSHYIKTGDNFIDPSFGPKTYADNLEFNWIKSATTKLLNVASTRFLVASDMIMTKPFASAVFKNNVKAWLKGEENISGKELEKRASELMGYTETNVASSTTQAIQDVNDNYGYDPFGEDVSKSIQKEASILLLLRTQELIFENSGIEESMGESNWLDLWNGESLADSATKEAKNLALQGEVSGFVGLVSNAVQFIIDLIPGAKFKVPFVNILGNMLNTSIKWVPLVGQTRDLARFAINLNNKSKGLETTSSATAWAIDKIGDVTNFRIIKEGVLEKYNIPMSKRQAMRDMKHMVFVTGVQTIIYALLAKEDDDDGLVITGSLDSSFFTRQPISEGTGADPFSMYWRDENGNHTKISEYKNSAYGFALSYFGALTDEDNKYRPLNGNDYIKAWASSAFFIADKPAATALNELITGIDVVDNYGRNKLLDETGYVGDWKNSLARFANSALVPNLIKQGTKITNQVYGSDKMRPTDWWSHTVNGLPFMDPEGSQISVDHFGRPIEMKLDMGFLGVEGSFKEGFSWGEPNDIDPYYEAYTDHGTAPKWITSKEIPVYEKKANGSWGKVNIEKLDGTVEKSKMRISKQDGHIINILIGTYRKEAIDNLVEYNYTEKELKKGVDALKLMNQTSFESAKAEIEKEAKTKAFIEFYENIYKGEIISSNKNDEKKYQKIE